MRRFIESMKEQLFSKETPESLAKNLRGYLSEITKNYTKLNPEQLNLELRGLDLTEFQILAEFRAASYSSNEEKISREAELNIKIALIKIIKVIEEYLTNQRNHQPVRILNFYNDFIKQKSTSRLRDLPNIVENLCINVESIKT